MIYTNFKNIFVSVRRRRRKIRRKSGDFQKQISREPLAQSTSNLVCKVRYMQSIKYVNLVEIRSVVFKIQEVEIGKILVHVNNTRVLRATFLAARHTTVRLNTSISYLIALFIALIVSCTSTTIIPGNLIFIL